MTRDDDLPSKLAASREKLERRKAEAAAANHNSSEEKSDVEIVETVAVVEHMPEPTKQLKPTATTRDERRTVKRQQSRSPAVQTDVVPPHSVESEMGVISSIMQDCAIGSRGVIAEVSAKINENFFYVPAHRTMYATLITLWRANRPIDMIIFTEYLRDHKLLDQVGDAFGVTDMYGLIDKVTNYVPTAANVESYVKTVIEHYEARETIAAATRLVRRAYQAWDTEGGMGALLDEHVSRIAAIRSLGRDGAQLSFRSPAEILAMPRNTTANFLGDHLLGVALSLVLAGIGGIGKSRLFLQLLVAFILERVWCGIETHHTKGKAWMLIQTQNSILRLQDDLERLRKYAGSKANWELVSKHLIVHTLETDRDLMLHLGEPRNRRDLESAIRHYDPIGVAFDPLNDVAIGDLSKDVDMMSTCHEIGRIARAGNPERAIVIATHALTGKAGMKKAFGFEAAGFGRNSKVLQTWARAFVNVIPATEDHNVLILTCGKNNNGKMFEPLAVRLNQETMIYEPEPDFDIEEFREQIERPKKRRTFEAEIVAQIDWPKPELDKKQLVAAVIEETSCSKPVAYKRIDEAVAKRLIRFNKQTEIYTKK
jgi:hypothetical protein